MKRAPLAGLTFVIALVLLLVVFKAASTAAFPLSSQQNGEASARIHPDLLKALESAGPDERLQVIVEWGRDPLLAERAGEGNTDKIEQRRAVVTALQDSLTQVEALRQTIDSQVAAGQAAGARYFWISPVISLRAGPDAIWELAEQASVVEIRLDRQIMLEEPENGWVEAAIPEGLLPNLEMVNARLANEALGLDGTGVVVANLDTGVDWQHPALMTHYRGYNPNGPAMHFGNWHDSTNSGYLYPGDGNGHGTHTMGTMVGDDGSGARTGVAPGASWIAVKVFTNMGGTYESWLHDGFEWILAPEGDPALAPDVVNNSWGSVNGSDDTYLADILALQAAGIVPVFSVGNNGPGEGTVQSPASLPGVISTGALDEEGVVATFSARGPSFWDDIKPELAAPGVHVFSTFPGGGYAYGLGTSMASPHTAGTIALLLQARPELQPSEIAELLKDTAEPLGDEHPNNNTGWGLINAYAAGMAVTHSGEVSGTVHSGEIAIPNPTITFTLRSGSPQVTISGEEDGHYRLALVPGLYDATASAFGYNPEVVYAINIVEDELVEVDFDLLPAPSGVIEGTVTDLESGSPLSATISVPGTPVQAQTDPATGEYSFWLPAGSWTIEAEAEEHRLGNQTITVDAGHTYSIDFDLPAAPSILLIDSGPWYYGSQIRYFKDALHSLGYSYDLYSIKNIMDPSLPDDRPISPTLMAYDIVIWSAPGDSPGMIRSEVALRDYLAGGGKLLISGEDVAFWDAGGTLLGIPSYYLLYQTSVHFEDQPEETVLVGAAGSPLEGLEVQLNTPDSAQNSTHPDVVTISDPLLAQPALFGDDQNVTAVTAGVCTPYKSAWLGFGVENAGPSGVREEILQRLIDWFETPPVQYDLTLESEAGPLISPPGSVITWTLTLHNTGVQTDTVLLKFEGGPFPANITTALGDFSGSTEITLGGCDTLPITATFTISEALPRDLMGEYTFRATGQGDATGTVSATVTVKTPAPILVVDSQNWYNHLDTYTGALDQLDLTYDVFDAYNSSTVVPTSTLQSYPMVIWVTGYNWAWPLDETREDHLDAYLESGGRLLITSQDAIDVVGIDEFMTNRLGVEGASLTVDSEAVLPTGSSPYLDAEGVWDLDFPYNNWSDGLLPAPDAIPVLQDNQGYINGLFNEGNGFRTAFYALPLETLPLESMRYILGQSLLWISSMGNSRLEAPPAAAAGSEITVTLALQLAEAPAAEGYIASLPIPEGMSFVPDSNNGGWVYNQDHNALEYMGDMCPT